MYFIEGSFQPKLLHFVGSVTQLTTRSKIPEHCGNYFFLWKNYGLFFQCAIQTIQFQTL